MFDLMFDLLADLCSCALGDTVVNSFADGVCPTDALMYKFVLAHSVVYTPSRLKPVTLLLLDSFRRFLIKKAS